MSTAILQSHVSTILPKEVATLSKNPSKMEEKPHFNRSCSIDTIKQINTLICSPESYFLPAIITTWLKTGQNSLHSSTEKTIFMFRSLIFGSVLFKFLLKGAKSGDSSGQTCKLDLQTVLLQIIANLNERLLIAIETAWVISLAFYLTVAVMTTQLSVCLFYLCQNTVPVGLGFLVLSASFITAIGHKLNAFYLRKRDSKRKSQ
ncbi:uncharacterized protein LOC109537144 [Dendroctonus ponderosae]